MNIQIVIQLHKNINQTIGFIEKIQLFPREMEIQKFFEADRCKSIFFLSWEKKNLIIFLSQT